jgi:hypothetical protein
MVLGVGDLRRLADAPQLDGVLLRKPVRRGGVRRVRDPVEELSAPALRLAELRFDALELRLDALELLDLLGRGLAFQLRLRSELVDARDELEPGAVGFQERVEVPGRPLACERRPHGVGIGPRGLDVDHARESK